MKKYKFLIDFLIGGSIFIISTILATFISLFFMGEGIRTVIAFKGIEYISLFVLGEKWQSNGFKSTNYIICYITSNFNIFISIFNL